MQYPIFYDDEIFKLMLRYNKNISVLRDYAEKH